MNNIENKINENNLIDYLMDNISLLKINNSIYEEDLKIICKIIFENSKDKNSIIEGLTLLILSLINENTFIIKDDNSEQFLQKKQEKCEKNEIINNEISFCENDNFFEEECDKSILNFNHYDQEEPFMDEALNKLRILSIERTRRLFPKEALGDEENK